MESLKHIELVRQLIKYAMNIEGIERAFLQYDLSESSARPKKMLEGFIPDVYYDHNNNLVIGEAKTSSDYNRPHSIMQYESYMKQCSFYVGKAILILIVPWAEAISTKLLIKRIRDENGYKFKILILDDIGKVVEM